MAIESGTLFTRYFFERIIAGGTEIFAIKWVLDSTFKSLFALGFFRELQVEWSMKVGILSDGDNTFASGRGLIAGKTRVFVGGWVPGCEVGSLFARGFFEELLTKWSVAASILGDGARAALKNCAAQSLLGRSLTGRKGTFASGRLLGMDWEKMFFIFFLGGDTDEAIYYGGN